ncbi:hypothetical protein SAMD00019534_121460 [Acytostelium subglobosum LB1]|uniref:hypothetical protein n=1 Tax=Acytostelium subglobosum LB1 TaxID=1410327 RepID=UPI000644806F|nr:hypothetical protein SAMD00019534_121460 [Acytostelium subglobosum LB1]GAM28970.1 hypothetical protein SAMD00019534_121460 [Acytostelium subglobosum LB1]|eukprot:XP_012748155.1 hypothetical protein SAMD00019534_121460 [Acytostelium subglobosum LB1]
MAGILSTVMIGALALVVVRYRYALFFSTYLLFIFSAIALSDVIMTVSIPLLLLSRNLFRKITNKISNTGWPLFTLAFEVLGRNKLIFTGDDLLAAQKTDRNALVVLNHTYHCDWLLSFSLGERLGRIGNIKIAMKDVIKYIPFVGVGIWAMGFIFLSRRWQDDQKKINKAFSHLKQDGEPFWFVTHPEGSRLSPKSLAECQRFARERGNVPLLENILLPRLKGFVSSVVALRDETDAIYDMTAAYAKPPGGFIQMLYGNHPSQIHIHLRRFDMAKLPKDEAEVGTWLYNLYKEKDDLLKHFKTHGHFPGAQLTHMMEYRASKYILNMVMWSVAVAMFMYSSVQLYYWSFGL